MDFLLSTFLSYLLIYKYAALFVITFLAALAFPIPSAAPLMASAAFASQNYLNIGWVVFVASLGNILGDNVGYWIARKYGKKFLYKVKWGHVLDSPNFKILERRLVKRPGFVIFLTRFEVIATISVNLLSGLAKMPYGKFLLFEIPGELFQVSIYATLGYVFGSSWQAVNSIIGKVSFVTTICVAIALVIFYKKTLAGSKKATL